MDPVVDTDGGMEDFPNARTFRERHSEPGKILQKVHVIK
jgi:hypothetical protein